ncbi:MULTISPECIES: hypothetical protein [Paenibacillus]|uniref:Uncharacterized protein n=1 Tax=Paenibacillus peoriae TaxID=59893 RepID=A0A7H0Y2W5_9BACL|nr:MULTISPECIES: hypothetical protein [Paenibacillus]QNR65423.1 hypothetical protein IAQ67_16135 [Paenibacillus peoriae]
MVKDNEEIREYVHQAIRALEHYLECELEDEDRCNTESAIAYFESITK